MGDCVEKTFSIQNEEDCGEKPVMAFGIGATGFGLFALALGGAPNRPLERALKATEARFAGNPEPLDSLGSAP
jgi:hypothetical protein